MVTGVIGLDAASPGGEGVYLYCRGPRRLIGTKAGCLWFYDVTTRAWRQIAPEYEIATPAFKPPPHLIGAALVHESVNNEFVTIGGQAPNVAGAAAGNWTFLLESKRWSRLPEPETSDEWPGRARCLADATGRSRCRAGRRDPRRGTRPAVAHGRRTADRRAARRSEDTEAVQRPCALKTRQMETF
jgi:hypothetical protein